MPIFSSLLPTRRPTKTHISLVTDQKCSTFFGKLADGILTRKTVHAIWCIPLRGALRVFIRAAAAAAAVFFPCKLACGDLSSTQSFDTAEPVACIPGSCRCGSGLSRDSGCGEARTTNESDAVASAKHGCAFSSFFQKRAGRSVHYNKISLSLSLSPLSPSLSLCSPAHAHAPPRTLAHTDAQKMHPLRALEQILYVLRFMLIISILDFFIIIIIRACAV